LFQVTRDPDGKASLSVTTEVRGAEIVSHFSFEDDSPESWAAAREALAVNATQEEADAFYKGMHEKFSSAANDSSFAS
jgi:hypothetical protein